MTQKVGQKQEVASQQTILFREIRAHQRRKRIQDVCEAIVDRFNPEKIVLFGSYVTGEPDSDSDVDLLVVMPFKGSPFRQAAAILDHVVHTVGVIPMDLLVRTAEQVQEQLKIGDGFMREILERGEVMYEADHA